MITYILKGHDIKTEKNYFILSESDFIKKKNKCISILK